MLWKSARKSLVLGKDDFALNRLDFLKVRNEN